MEDNEEKQQMDKETERERERLKDLERERTLFCILWYVPRWYTFCMVADLLAPEQHLANIQLLFAAGMSMNMSI